jgi:hypothetical protein
LPSPTYHLCPPPLLFLRSFLPLQGGGKRSEIGRGGRDRGGRKRERGQVQNEGRKEK